MSKLKEQHIRRVNQRKEREDIQNTRYRGRLTRVWKGGARKDVAGYWWNTKRLN